MFTLVICSLSWAAPQTGSGSGGSGVGGSGGGAGSGSGSGGGGGAGSGSGGSGSGSGTGMSGMMTTANAVTSLFPMILAGASFAMVGNIVVKFNPPVLHMDQRWEPYLRGNLKASI